MKRTTILVALVILVGGCSRQQSYADGCGPLPSGWITPRDGRGVLSLLNKITVAADGTLSWNGVAVSEPTLAAYLKQTSELDPEPVTQIEFASAVNCVEVARLRRLMAETLNCRDGNCAEGSGKWWRIGDVVFEGQSPEPYDPDVSAANEPRL